MSDPVRLRAADLPISIDASDRTLTITFTDGRDLSGTWAMVVKDEILDAAPSLSPTVDTTDAATGVIHVPFTGEELFALLGTELKWQGVHAITQNGMVLFTGKFTIFRTAYTP